VRDRRAAQRYKLTLPLVIRLGPVRSESDLVYGKTRDISSHGIYFTSQQRLALGTKLDVSFALPREITQGTQVSIAARAIVVRVEEQEGNVREPVGAAAVIETYEFLRTESARERTRRAVTT